MIPGLFMLGFAFAQPNLHTDSPAGHRPGFSGPRNACLLSQQQPGFSVSPGPAVRHGVRSGYKPADRFIVPPSCWLLFAASPLTAHPWLPTGREHPGLKVDGPPLLQVKTAGACHPLDCANTGDSGNLSARRFTECAARGNRRVALDSNTKLMGIIKTPMLIH